MQADGNLVVYDASGNVWSATQTAGTNENLEFRFYAEKEGVAPTGLFLEIGPPGKAHIKKGQFRFFVDSKATLSDFARVPYATENLPHLANQKQCQVLF